jgi:predicted amidophosphoribosyltransferase
MARKSICSDCGEVLEPTNKDYVVCGNCGEFQWVDFDQKIEEEPTISERLREAAKKYKAVTEEMGVPGKFHGNKVMKSTLVKKKRNKKY